MKLIRCFLFSRITNWEISKSDLTILFLKEMRCFMGSLVKFKCYELGYAKLSEKVAFSRISAPKMVSLLKK